MDPDPAVARAEQAESLSQPYEQNINHATDEQLPNDKLLQHTPPNATKDVHNDKDSVTRTAGDAAVNGDRNQDQGEDEGDERGYIFAGKVRFDVSGSIQSAYLKTLEDRLRLLEEKLNVSSEDAMTVPKVTKTIALDEDTESSSDDEALAYYDHNILTLTQWRRMKYNEGGPARVGEAPHIIDVIFDRGDLSLRPDGMRLYRLWRKASGEDKDYEGREQSRFHLFSAWMENQMHHATENGVPLDKWLGDQDGHDSWIEEMEKRSFKTDVVGRIRINSEIIIDTLNEITGFNLPTPCIFLHPFKVLVANEKIIRGHYQELLTEDKNNRETAEIDTKEERSMDETDHPLIPGEENAAESTAQLPESDSTDKRATPEAQGNGFDEVLAQKEERKRMKRSRHKLTHFERLIDVMDTFLNPELRIAEEIAQHRLDHIYFSHLWHLFPPGEVIMERQTRPGSPEQLYRIVKVSGGRHNLTDLDQSLDDQRQYVRLQFSALHHKHYL